jgi:hypothetical protein
MNEVAIFALKDLEKAYINLLEIALSLEAQLIEASNAEMHDGHNKPEARTLPRLRLR